MALTCFRCLFQKVGRLKTAKRATRACSQPQPPRSAVQDTRKSGRCFYPGAASRQFNILIERNEEALQTLNRKLPEFAPQHLETSGWFYPERSAASTCFNPRSFIIVSILKTSCAFTRCSSAFGKPISLNTFPLLAAYALFLMVLSPVRSSIFSAWRTYTASANRTCTRREMFAAIKLTASTTPAPPTPATRAALLFSCRCRFRLPFTLRRKLASFREKAIAPPRTHKSTPLASTSHQPPATSYSHHPQPN